MLRVHKVHSKFRLSLLLQAWKYLLVFGFHEVADTNICPKSYQLVLDLVASHRQLRQLPNKEIPSYLIFKQKVISFQWKSADEFYWSPSAHPCPIPTIHISDSLLGICPGGAVSGVSWMVKCCESFSEDHRVHSDIREVVIPLLKNWMILLVNRYIYKRERERYY